LSLQAAVRKQAALPKPLKQTKTLIFFF